MSYSAVDIANYFINLFRDEEEHPTNLKLNKMAYFAQGHILARNGHVLFDEDIQAWEYGPVVPSIYTEFKSYRKRGVAKPSRVLPDFSDEDKDLLLEVALLYGRYTGSALTDMTHRPNTPWSDVYVEGQKNILISQDSMKKYFSEEGRILPSIDELVGELKVVEWNDVV